MLDDRRAESFVLSFRDGIALLEQPDGGTVLRSSDAEITLGRPSPGFRTALRVLSSDGATEEQLQDLVSREGGGEGEVSKVSDYLRYFTQHMPCCVTQSHGTEADWLRSSLLHLPGAKYPTNQLPRGILRSRDLSTCAKMPAN